MSGPVFGKPSRRSKEHKDHSYASNAPFESTTEAAAPPNKRSSLRTSAATDAHLRIVSLQIGEREAVHAMKDLCEECSTSFGVSAKVDEVVDALSGVLVVGDLLRRLGREKSHLEQTLERRTREHDVTLGHKHELMEQMEAMIARLQAEAAQAEDRAQEAAMRHTHRVTLLNKEMQNVREELAEVRGENERLRAQLEAQQAALMNVPRLEEQFMRNARSAVRQSEVANTLNRIEFRKMEEELRSLTFWKNKAKALQETIGRLSAAVDQLDAQNRLNLSRYQNLLRATRNGSGTSGGGGDAAPFAAPVAAAAAAAAATTTPTTATATATATAKGRGARRPLSAPSTRRSASAATVRPAAAASAAPASPVAALDAGGSVSVSGSGAAAATAAGAAAGGANAAEEILRLRGELRAKERLVVTLAQRLSFARSRPLLATTDDDDAAVAAAVGAAAGDAADATHDDDGDGGGDEAQQRPATLSAQAQRDRDEALAMRSANPLIGVALGDLPYMRDAADDSSLARAEDAALHDERVARAVALQLQYAARQHERRLQGPPHVVAIRQARSFGRVVDELVAQRDAAFLSQKLATSQRDIMFAAL